MKTFSYFLVSIILLLGVKTYSQEKYATYDNTFVDKTYDISVSFKDGGEFSLWINALSLDRIIEVGGYYIKQAQLEGFLNNLNSAKAKYLEWVAVAKTNDVKELEKAMEIKSKKINSYFRYGGDWHFDFHVKPTFSFKIVHDEITDITRYLLIVRSGKLNASDNEYIDCDGFAFVFTSEEEITEFENLISYEKIESFKNKPKSDDLFK